MSLGEILDTGFRVVRNHFWLLIVLAGAVYVPLALFSKGLDMLLNPAGPASPEEIEAALPYAIALGALMLLVLAAVWPISFAAMTFAVGELFVGRAVTLSEALRSAFKVAMPMIGTSILYGLIVLLGFALLILPGIYLVLSYLLVWQVMILERTFGMRALRRSRDLMRGNILRGLAVVLVGALIVVALSWAVQIGVASIPVVGVLAATLAQAAGSAFTTAVAVILYFDIRCRKESFDLEHLAGLVEAAARGDAPAR